MSDPDDLMDDESVDLDPPDDDDASEGLSQIKLLSAIWSYLTRVGYGTLNPRQINATIKAADLIIEAVLAPDVKATPAPPDAEPETAQARLDTWLKSDDTGMSSEAMAMRLAPLAGLRCRWSGGLTFDRHAHPLDPSDYGRCARLLEAVPELRPHLREMMLVSPAWAALIERWDDLESMYQTAVKGSGQAPEMLALMRTLTEEAR